MEDGVPARQPMKPDRLQRIRAGCCHLERLLLIRSESLSSPAQQGICSALPFSQTKSRPSMSPMDLSPTILFRYRQLHSHGVAPRGAFFASRSGILGTPLQSINRLKSTASAPPGERTLGNVGHRGADRTLDRP